MPAATLYALARIGYAAGLVGAPAQVAGAWVGKQGAESTAAQIALRGLAGRDAAISLGILGARARGRSARAWLLLAAAGDAADIAATMNAREAELPPNARRGTLALAGASALIGVALAARG